MTRPDLSRPQVVDRFYYEYGFNVIGGPHPDVPTTGTGFCSLAWQPLPDGRLLVVAYEHPDNPGRSVTNAAEDIAEQFAEAAGVHPARLVWVESYAAARWPARSPAFDRCTFDPAGDEARTSWRPMTASDWRALGIERPAVPRLARRPDGPSPTPRP